MPEWAMACGPPGSRSIAAGVQLGLNTSLVGANAFMYGLHVSRQAGRRETRGPEGSGYAWIVAGSVRDEPVDRQRPGPGAGSSGVARGFVGRCGWLGQRAARSACWQRGPRPTGHVLDGG